MKEIILGCLLLGFLLSGCSTTTEKERILEKGSFLDKVNYIERNYSSKDEVVEFLGLPEKKQDFYHGVSIWSYEATEMPLEIVFGTEGRILRLDIESNRKY